MKTFKVSMYLFIDSNYAFICIELFLLFEANILIDNLCMFLANDEESK